ncbi:MAG: carotenoid 1,2-hydratase [Anaerolineae bacterium]|nr:carotenoid 1,2-hydratase [Anaerolineae bacterium]
MMIVLALLVLAVATWGLLSRGDGGEIRAQLVAPAAAGAGFARVEGPRPFDPALDFGPHPDYQTEWWYYTGNLATADGRRFGYQLTFFRRALVPPAARQARASAWAADQVYLAHFALTDVAAGEHQAFERFTRGAAGLAGAQSPPYRVWLEDWSVAEVAAGTYRLAAAQDGLAVDLLLVDRKGPVLHGEAGYSQKGPEPGNASFYFSQTRLDASGTVTVGGTPYAVTGTSWMDHEFSTSALAADQVGWDWFALQLDDGSEVMVFQIRRADGSIDPFSSGTFVAPDGTTRHLARAEFEIAVPDTWRSRRSGAVYPARWSVDVPAIDLRLEIEPYVADQEMRVSYTYWEGAVEISGTRGGAAVTGSGYVEMTGYAGSMQAQF